MRTVCSVCLTVAAALIAGLLCSARAADSDASTMTYGATAAAVWKDKDGEAHVAAGFAANYTSQEEADRDALLNCQNNGGEGCKIAGRFSNGSCGYITIGVAVADKSVSWGAGPTKEDALDGCQKAGLACREPVGGCTHK